MKNRIDVQVGRQITRKIDELNVERAEVASTLGVAVTHLRLIESGDARASAKQLWTLTKIWDVPASYFYEADDTKKTLH